ncbi:MAG: TonB-dependent receptor [Saprospiraceae bacterium]|nr:TonB-dependent receptor [Saprospiraceae bacterium]
MLQAQNVSVTGIIKDESGEGLPGASVVIKGTTQGAITDTNGSFVLDAPKGGTLLISYVGYDSQEIIVNNNTPLSIQLQTDGKSLSEVVVVGYGTQKKADVTGAVSSVNLETLRNAPNTNIGQYLQGTVPGLNVGLSTSAGGTPPISIRGRVTLSGSQSVLIILDGIQYTGSLSSINPDDIASIDVLKDASSTAVYGAQGANGVILITSRKGKFNQRPSISFSSAYTSQTPTVGNLKPWDRDGYINQLTESNWDKSYLAPNYTEKNPAFKVQDVADATMRDGAGNLLPNNYNWFEEATNTGSIQENNLSISGGSDKVNYLLSGSLVGQKGFILNDIFKRKSIRANLEVQPLDWLKVGLVSSGSFVNQDGQEPSFGNILNISPLLVPYNADGSLIPFPTNTLTPSPFTTNLVDDKERHMYLFANIYTDINIPFIKGLSYRLNYGNNYRLDQRFNSSIFAAGLTGQAYKNNADYYDYTLDNIVTYNRAFGKHEVTGTLLYGAIERDFNSVNARAEGFTRLTLSYNNLNLGTNKFSESDAWHEALNYQMARVNYKFNDRYLFTGTVRRDGFSGFAKNNKSAIFPVAALGWIVSEEGFMKNIKAIEFLKLRAGYGSIGNQTSRYTSIARVSTNAAYVFGDGGTTAFGQQVTSLGNDDLKWERTTGLNLGADFTLLNSKLSGSIEYYNNNTTDLLYSVAIPSVTGFGSISTNLGKINNTGLEAAINYRVLNLGGFKWNTTLNFSQNNNKIVTLTGVDADKDGKEDDLISSNLFIGKPISTIYHYQTNGINGLTDTRLPSFPVGTVKIVDQNGDNDITPEKDRIFLGRADPAYRASWINTFEFKGLTLSVLLNSIQGGKDGYLANNNPSYFREDNSIRNNYLQAIDFWSPNNPTGKYSRNISGSRPKVAPNVYQSRSFIRLQDISLSYNLANLIKGNKLKAFSIYASAKNLKTWTNWEGWDPETGEGLTAGGRPVLRAYTVGINITY